jgi:class 3 adenylate cyclase
VTQLPLGTVTFLFTDIEASTELTRRLGPAFGDVRRQHRSLVRTAISAHGGHEIDNEGDGFFVAFDRASDAVAAAAAAQHAVAGAAWPEAVRVAVRMGIHTTEAYLHDDGYVGVGVSRAARICAAAHGGQIVASAATAGVIEDLDLPGVQLRELGEHRLKDIQQPQRLFQVGVEGLATDFPSLSVGGAAGSIATLLLTDLAGWRDVMRDLGDDATTVAAAAYHNIVTEIVQEHGGRVIEAVADNVLSLFPHARDAVFAAAEIVEALREQHWIAPTHVPEVAAAIHTGRVVDPDAGHLGSTAFSVTRLCSDAAGSQVLVSDTTRGLLEGEPLAPFALRYVDDRAISTDGIPRRVFELTRDPP